MTKNCEYCGKPFTAKRNDAKFCSSACKQAFYRITNLAWRGTVIRGQHAYDVAPTGLGIVQDKCRQCGKEFSRWLESKLARLVRNEVEGTTEWNNRDFDRVKFDELKAIRMEEVKYCSDECQEKGPRSIDYIKQYPVTPEDAVQSVVLPENGQSDPHVTPKRRGA